jgi:hypothetical protein
MPERIVLLGAGFSRNWGGWLADEVFEYLLGDKGVQANPDVRRALWGARPRGGFETALAELQAAAARSERFAAENHQVLQTAVEAMFADMNKAFEDTTSLDLTNDVALSVQAFLARFDAIFSLNQDLLLEAAYLGNGPTLTSPRRWAGAYFPGMRPLQPPQSGKWGAIQWGPEPEGCRLSPHMQPVFKLHGSSNWVDEGGRNVLILGGNKTGAIAQSPLLSAYQSEFERRLVGGAKLMTIGYSFRDEHINSVIEKAAGTAGIFIVDPAGVDVLSRTQPGQIPAPQRLLHDMIIGGSRRGLREIFGRDAVERTKVFRFFDD